MKVIIGNDIVDVVIIYKNNKNIYLRFKEDGKLYATCNRFTRESTIKKLIDDNIEKIAKMYEEVKKSEESNLFFQYLGKKYTICYLDNYKVPFIDQDMIYVKNKKTLDKFYKEECQRVFQSEVDRIVPYFDGIPKFTLKIRNMKTRWGVNNRGSNTITLNSELLKKDIDLLDYVIIHELCHFYEANHSKRFWEQVARFYPKYKEARKRLKEV